MARDCTQDEVIKDLERVIEKQDAEIARLREALSKLEENLWNMTNAVDDGDWYGDVPIFGRVVAHKFEYHKLHVDRLEKMKRFARSALQVVDAIDEIEKLREERSRLREALKKIVELDGYAADGYEYHKLAIKIARDALKEGE